MDVRQRKFQCNVHMGDKFHRFMTRATIQFMYNK